MIDLGQTTISVLAGAKIILALSLVIFFVLSSKFNKPHLHLLNITFAVVAFTVFLLWPLKRMWWGNNGDEVFVGAFLTRVLHGEFMSDFYYGWLTPFYPPFYFWVVGAVSSFVTQSAIASAKIGAVLSLLVLFVGSYTWQWLYWAHVGQTKSRDNVEQSAWFWLLAPLLFLLALDFETFLVKPYETGSALFGALFIGYFARAIQAERWTKRTYLFFGLTGGLLFLTYYFWWFMLVPAMIVLTMRSGELKRNFTRLVGLGALVAIVASPYLVPLGQTFLSIGLENWQAAYFVPQDFLTFVPWAHVDLRLVLFLVGLFGLVFYRRSPFSRGVGLAFVMAYLYQLVNIILFLTHTTPAQSGKPFLFLGTALLMVAAAQAVVIIAEKYRGGFSTFAWQSIITVAVLVLVPLTPMVRFIDDPVVQQQIEKDITPPSALVLSQKIVEQLPEYKNVVWLSSGDPELNLYIPLTYYIAHNPHFSHPSSHFYARLDFVKKLTGAASAVEFSSLIDKKASPHITGLLLYYDVTTKTYPLFFWQDNYPNGGKELRLDLNPSLIAEHDWQMIFHDGQWFVFVRK